MVQRKCKPNAIKLAWIAEVKPFLSKESANRMQSSLLELLRWSLSYLKKVQTECNQACLNCRVAAFLIKGYTQQNIGSEGMTAEEQKRYINYLVERLEQADLGLRARDAVLQDFLDKQKEYDERLSKLDNVLSKVSSLESSLKEKERKLKSAERKVADLSAKLKFAEKNRFGDKSYGSKKKNQPWIILTNSGTTSLLF